MPSLDDYAQLAAAVYDKTAINTIPTAGWQAIYTTRSTTGFEATAYAKGGEVVIAYAGTNGEYGGAQDFLTGNIPAGVGNPSAQVEQAMQFYVAVRRANPNASISFTGHSLGGGLASLMAVYFDKPATVFDPAPFAASTVNLSTLQYYQDALRFAGLSDPDFDRYNSDVLGQYSARVGGISAHTVEGEILLSALGRALSIISPSADARYVTYGNTTAINLHSVLLLGAMIASSDFSNMIKNNADILPLIFDTSLYASQAQFSTTPDFMHVLMQKAWGGSPSVLSSFAQDLNKLNGDSGVAATQMRSELSIVAMEYYYFKSAPDAAGIFKTDGGAIHFQYSDIGAMSYHSLPRLVNAFNGLLSTDERRFAGDLTKKDAWHIQNGGGAMNLGTGSAQDNDAAIGGVGNDIMQSGAGDDFLSGGAGDDQLDGGADDDVVSGGVGNDTLRGGAGNDTAVGGGGDDDINGGEGNDSLLGGSGKDILSGGEGNDTLRGEGDDDLLLGYAGNDLLEGGESTDVLDGGTGNDTLRGDAGDDTLTGDDGMDQLVGGAGDDVLDGADGQGGDVLTGGIGHDIYRADDGDTIYDEDGQGEIWLNGKRLTEATRKKGETVYHDDAGNTYMLQGGRLLINDPLVVSGFSSGKLGIVLKEDDDDDDDPDDPHGKDLFRNSMLTSDPLVLDLDGGGIATRGIGQGAFFDFDGNGFAERTAWVAAGEGILVRDLNGDGKINTGAELFGDKTALPGGALAADGYAALSALDSDQNGIVDKRDAAWTELQVWRDANGDGVSDAAEMVSLDVAGVKSIKLSSTPGSRNDQHGNDHKLVSIFTRADGSEGLTADIWFRSNLSSTRYETSVTLTDDLLQLPDLQGTGNVANLLQAMAGDASGRLEAVVRQYAASSSLNGQFELLKTVVLTWAGVQDVDPASRGKYVKDARVLAALEKFYGTNFFDARVFGANPGPGAIAPLESAFAALLVDFGAALDSQTRFKPFYDKIHLRWDAATQALVGNLDDVAAVIKTQQFDSVEQAGGVMSAFIAALRITHTLEPFSLAAFVTALGALGTQLNAYIVSAWGGYAGTEGNDRITGKDAGEPLFGFGGNDYIVGGGGADTIDGGAGDDQLDGSAGDDVLRGGAGDDWLTASAGNDTLLFAAGDGRDTVQNGGIGEVDRLQFLPGIAAGDITVQRTWENLTLTRSGSTDTIVIIDYFAADRGQIFVEFADGTVWDTAAIQAKLAPAGTAGADYLIGFESGDAVLGLAGNDTIEGRGGNDTLSGGDGDDNLNAGAGSDLLSGGAGNDLLYGGAGADVYLYGGGDGHDTINEVADGSLSEVRFDATIDAGQLRVARGAYGLVVSIGNEPRLSINNNAMGTLVFRFANGFTWDGAEILRRVVATDGDDYLQADSATVLGGAAGNDTVNGSSGDDTLGGGTGNDLLYGGGGNDVYLYALGDGMDAIIGGTSRTLRLGADIEANSVSTRSDAQGQYLSFADGGSVRFDSTVAFRVEFSDGTVWDSAYLDAKFAQGTIYDDVLVATSALRQLEGREGNDRLYGTSMDDTLTGGQGDDTISGGAGADVYRFARGDGNDLIDPYYRIDPYYLGVGDDVIEFAPSIVADDVVVVSQSGAIVLRLRGSADSITVRSGAGWPTVRFADGTLWTSQMVRDRSLQATEFNDYLTIDTARASLDGLAGDDFLQGDARDNTLIGGDGNDILYGDLGDDTYVYSRGKDHIYDSGANNTLRFDAGVTSADLRLESQYGRLNLLVRDRGAVSFDNSVTRFEFADGTVWTYNDILGLKFIGGDGNDTLQSDGADRLITGGGGHDMLIAGTGVDTLVGGAGNDVLIGSGGNDVFLYARGDGDDRIQLGGAANEHSVLRFQPGIDTADVRVARSGWDVVLTIGPEGGQITLTNWLSPSSRLGQFSFADGTVWDARYLLNLFTTGTDGDDQLTGTVDDNVLSGEAGNDRLSDWQGNDTFAGGTGDDWMQGSVGDNVYLYRRGDGVDEISDGGGVDELRFDGAIAVAGVSVERDGDSIVLRVADGGAVRILYFSASNYPIERVVFADGTVWSAAQLLATPFQGTAEHDRLYGSEFGDSMNGGAGDDYIAGRDGADTIAGGIGDDYLDGGAGADVYRFERGDGRDVISGYSHGEHDVVRLGAGIAIGDLQFRRDAGNVYLDISGTEDGITFSGWTGAMPAIERIEFADGTSLSAHAIWDQVSQPSTGDDWLASSGAALHGLAGNDTLVGGDEGDALYGDQGDDVLSGGAGADLITGGEGDDSMDGGAGDDVYLIDAGDGFDDIVDSEGTNTVKFASGILPDHVSLRRFGYGMIMVELAGAQSFRIYVGNGAGEDTIPRFEFGDGTIWDGAAVSEMLLQGGAGSEWMVGTIGDDLMLGRGGDDTMRGGLGNDTLQGGGGYDVLIGAEGDDTYLYARGDGHDVIEFADGYGKDTIQFGAGITAADLTFDRQYGSLRIVVGASEDDSLLLQQWFGGTFWQDIAIRFADGTLLTAAQIAVLSGAHGTEGNDTLSGGSWDDTLSAGDGNDYVDGWLGDDLLNGGTGDDVLNGSSGNDVYLFNRGDGRDTVYALGTVVEDRDIVRFGAGITADDIQVSRERNSIVLAIAGTGDAVTIWPWFGPGTQPGLTGVEFFDGTVWRPDDLLQRLVFPTTEGRDWLGGFETNDVIDGKGGDDLLWGGDGDDTLIGGSGDDYLTGDAGSDVYRYAAGDGSDRYDFETVGGTDTLAFGEGVQTADIGMSRDLYNLYLRMGTSGETLSLLGWFGEDGYARGPSALSRITFADGTIWTPASTAALLAAMTVGDRFVLGGATDDTLLTHEGNDTLYGGGGNDTLDAGIGSNSVSGGLGHDVYRYSGGDLTIEDWCVGVGEQDRLEIAGIDPAGLSLSNPGGDLNIVDGDGQRIIRIVAYFATDSNGNFKSGDIAFADGTVWTRASVVGMLPLRAATEGPDYLQLTIPGVIDGLGGDDHLVGVSDSTLRGGDGDDLLEITSVGNDTTLHGDDGNDRLQVEGGARDLLYGDAGDDSLEVRKGAAMVMDGGDGADYLQLYAGDNNTLRGGAGLDNMQIQQGDHNWLYGDAEDDTIQVRGNGTDNHAYGGQGNDTLMGADGGNGDLYGDAGNDQLEWNGGANMRLYGGDGNDQLQSSGGSGHLLDGGIGNDVLRGFSDNDTLLGGDGDDTMQVNNTGAWMEGGAGNDLMNIYAANSTLFGGDGDDTLEGSNNNIVMRGGAGKDRLSTNGVASLLDGGADDDSISVGGGSDMTILGGEGNDTVSFGAGARNLIDGGDGDDILQIGAYQANVVRGGAGADTIGVGYGSAQIEGGAGNDSITTGGANQFVVGGAGNDRITVQNGTDIVAFNLGDGMDTMEGSGADATLSLGGGVEYADLLFSRDQTDLILRVGDTDQLRLKDWYNADELHRTVSQLQFILDGGTGYDATSTDALRNQRTTLFNFHQLVEAFDSAQLTDPTLSAWSVTNALIGAHLGGGNMDAIGGELAYQYGRLGNLDGITIPASMAVLAAAEFGVSRQQFQPLAS